MSFTAGATFQAGLSLIGLICAFLSPGLFKLNGTPANGPMAAVGVVLFMLVFGLVLNTTISAAGSGLWVLARRVILKPAAVTS